MATFTEVDDEACLFANASVQLKSFMLCLCKSKDDAMHVYIIQPKLCVPLCWRVNVVYN